MYYSFNELINFINESKENFNKCLELVNRSINNEPMFEMEITFSNQKFIYQASINPDFHIYLKSLNENKIWASDKLTINGEYWYNNLMTYIINKDEDSIINFMNRYLAEPQSIKIKFI